MRVWATRQTADSIFLIIFLIAVARYLTKHLKEDKISSGFHLREGMVLGVWGTYHTMPIVRKQKEMDAGVQLACSFLLFIQLGTLACGRGCPQSTFSLGLPSLVEFLWTHLHKYAQRCASLGILKAMKWTAKMGYFRVFQPSTLYFADLLFSNKSF